MKKMMLVLSVAFVSLSSCSQDMQTSEVPSVVQNTLKTRFAGALKVEWEKKNALFEAEFDMDSTEYTAHIDLAGKLISHKTDIPESGLPLAVATAIRTGHAGFKIDEAEKLEKDGVTYYQVELEAKGKKDKQLVFSPDGSIAQAITYMN